MASRAAFTIPTMDPAVAIAMHTNSLAARSSASQLLSKEVKLDELSKYFHLPEKAVAKELGICLTSLKKLCRSYGITRWPFRKLKSLERTMRKVQTESEAAANGENGDGETASKQSNEVKRKPYTVGNRTVFLSDEELEVFKMTMGKEQAKDLIPTPMSTLEPALVHNATMAAASSALASVARGPLREIDDGSCFLSQEDDEANNGRRMAKTLSACSAASLEGAEDCVIKVAVKGNSLEIVHWSTLWSQPQLKLKLLVPLNGTDLCCSRDGTTATLTFASAETAKRALRICHMAQNQAVLAHTHESIGSHTFKHGKASKSYSYKGVAALAALDIVTPAIPMPNDYGMAPPSPPSPPESCSTLLDVLPRMPRSGNSLGVPPAPHTNIHALLAGSFSTGHQQPLTSNSAHNFLSQFLGSTSGPASIMNAFNMHGTDGIHVKEENTRSGKGLGVLGESLPSPPMSSASMSGMMEGSLSLSGPLSSIFPNMFQMNGNGKENGSGSGVTPPHSTDSLGHSFFDEGMGESCDLPAKDNAAPKSAIEQPATKSTPEHPATYKLMQGAGAVGGGGGSLKRMRSNSTAGDGTGGARVTSETTACSAPMEAALIALIDMDAPLTKRHTKTHTNTPPSLHPPSLPHETPLSSPQKQPASCGVPHLKHPSNESAAAAAAKDSKASVKVPPAPGSAARANETVGDGVKALGVAAAGVAGACAAARAGVTAATFRSAGNQGAAASKEDGGGGGSGGGARRSARTLSREDILLDRWCDGEAAGGAGGGAGGGATTATRTTRSSRTR